MIMMNPKRMRRSANGRRSLGPATLIICVGFVAAVVSGVVSYRVQGRYGEVHEFDPRVRKEFDPRTGQLLSVAFDSDGNLRLDTWSYMEADRLIRMDVDDDENGTIDRRSFYSTGEVLDRTEHVDSGGGLISTEYFSDGAVVGSEPAARRKPETQPVSPATDGRN